MICKHLYNRSPGTRLPISITHKQLQMEWVIPSHKHKLSPFLSHFSGLRLSFRSPLHIPFFALCISIHFTMRFTSFSILLSVALLAGMATAAPLPDDTHIDIDIHARRLHRHRKQNQNAVVPTQSATVQPQNCGTPPAPAAPPAPDAAAAPVPEATPAPAPAPAPEAAADFRLKNALAAQQLNAAFAALTTDAPCSAGQDACIGGAFAQCVNGVRPHRIASYRALCSLRCFRRWALFPAHASAAPI